MISYVLLYDRLPDSFFLQHTLSLNRFSGLRIGGATYGVMLRGLPALAKAEFVSLAEGVPGSARQMWDQGKRALRDRKADVKDDAHLLLFDMRHYPVDWEWFQRLLTKLELTDIPLVVRHLGRTALVGARWADSADAMDGPETAVIEHTDGRLVDTGRTDNVLRLVSASFSLRYFNKLRFGRAGYFRKNSLDAIKVQAEYEFLSSLPAEVRPFFPAVGEQCQSKKNRNLEKPRI